VAWSKHDRVGRYRLLAMIGVGRSCHVWEVLDDISGERRAIKVLKDEYAGSREHRALLNREFAVGRGLNHPQVIRIYEFHKRRGVVHIVMELFPARNVKESFLEMGVEAFAYYVPKIAEQAAVALGYLHEQGWLHRDVKPDNFLMNRDGVVKLIDFALADRSRGLLGRLFGRRLKIQGTRSYMSPEQIRGRGVDERSDVYGLGCMLHELAAGKPPFTGQNTQELLTKHLRNAPPPLEAAGRDVTTEFAELVRKMLSKSPAQRPHSMTDVVRALRGMQVYNRIPDRPLEAKSGKER